MSALSRARAHARGVAGRARRYTQGLTIRAQRRLRPGLVPGLLSVVVPCYNVEEYLDECLASLRAQDYRRIELIVVDDGSPDRSWEIARAHQRRDPRIRIVRKENGGLSAARNTGIDHARGEFLTFIDSDDVVRARAFSAPIEAMTESGSDFAVTLYDRIEKTARKAAERHIRRAHVRRRLGETVDTFPEAMVNAVVWSKTFRREFWDSAGLRFPEGRLYEDQPVSMAAYAKAASFDVLPDIGVSWRIRYDRSSISQASNTVRNLREHTYAVHESLDALRVAGNPRAAEERALQVLANNMPYFVRHSLRADDEFWQLLRIVISELVETLPPDLLASRVHSQNKLLYEFVMSNRWDEARSFMTNFGTDARRYRTWLDAEGVHCAHPLSEALPTSCTIMSDAQLELYARALRLALSPDGLLSIDGWAYIRNVDLASYDFTLRLELVNAAGERIPVDAATRFEPYVDLVGDHWYCDFRPGGFGATADLRDLPAGSWELVATLTVANDDYTLTREGPVRGAGIAGTGQVAQVVAAGEDDYLWVDAIRRPVTVSRGAAADLAPEALARASARGEGLSLPTAEAAGPVVVDYAVTDDALTLEVIGLPPGAGRPVMYQGRHLDAASVAVSGAVSESEAGRARVRFPLQREHWGRPGLALPSGGYLLRIVGDEGDVLPLTPSADLLDRMPLGHLTALARVELQPAPGAPFGLAVRLSPPLSEEQWGPRNQRLLHERHRVARAEDRSVFFRALYGEVANCNGLGVHEELRRRGSDLELLWSVVDHSVPVPDGGRGLIEGSEEWHAAIARSRYHMVNVHQLEWFSRPEGQVIIETMHGYPYKIMGHEWWRKGHFPPSQVANYDRRAREWDYFVSPASYATPLLKAAFLEPAGSEAEVLEIGYPRNDVLQSARADDVRRRTRRLLGVDPRQTVVMYAPTFRDYLSTNDTTAARVEFFDERRAAADLGEDFVVLVRGHAFNARANDRVVSEGNVIDVTDYPDINDLILASDVAILDYSSLRFDYAITGNPMIFLVPDLDAYDAARGGVIDYAPTAPGPRVTTTRQVVELLRDPAGLRASTAGLIARFRREYVDLDDGHAAARLVDAVFVPRGDAPPAPAQG